jgi:hypothetical protein
MVMADAVQALGQHMRQEAPNELAGWQGHGLIAWRGLDFADADLVFDDRPRPAVRPLDPVILPLERDAGLIG